MPKASSVAAIGVSLAVAFGGSAAAQVLEIGDDGSVTTHAAPAVYSAPGEAPAPILTPGSATITPIRRTAGPQLPVPEAIWAAADRSGVSPRVLEAIAWQESRFNPNAISPKGAVGVMQLMPDTARALGVDPFDVGANIEGGAAYFAGLLRQFNGDLTLALAAYNAGPGAVRRYAGVPPFRETRAYVDAILSRLAGAVAAERIP